MNSIFLKQAYYSNSKEAMDALISYLEEIGGRKFKPNQISNYITKTKWKKQESIILFRVHIQVIVHYLKAINYDFNTDIRIIKSIVADITEVFKTFENNSKEDLDWIMISSNVLPSFVHFKHAKGLFQNKQIGCSKEKSNEYDLLSVYGARLALEKRILSLIKIDYVLEGNSPIGLSKILALIESFESIKFDDELDWKLIIKINKWINHFIHRQIRPWPWTIYKIYEYLEVILGSGVIKENGKNIYSFYYSTVIIDEQNLEDETIDKLTMKFENVKLKWSHKHEAVILNQ